MASLKQHPYPRIRKLLQISLKYDGRSNRSQWSGGSNSVASSQTRNDFVALVQLAKVKGERRPVKSPIYCEEKTESELSRSLSSTGISIASFHPAMTLKWMGCFPLALENRSKVYRNDTRSRYHIITSTSPPFPNYGQKKLCMDGYWDDITFHRITKGFITQGGDLTGTEEGGKIYGEPFKDEFHTRLRFCRRNLIAMVNTGKMTMVPNTSLFLVLHQICRISMQSLVELLENLYINDKQHYLPRLIKTIMLNNPFSHIIPRITVQRNSNLLSFGGEAKEDEEESVKLNKTFNGEDKSAHDHLTDPKLSSQPVVEPSGLANKKRKEGCSSDWESDDEVQTQGELEVVEMKTTVGDVELELWAKETPKARFITQGGESTGTGEGGKIYGEPFKDEFHTRLRFCRRDLIAMPNAGKTTMVPNTSLFIVLPQICRISIQSLVELLENLYINDKQHYLPRLTKTIMLNNPFSHIIPRITVQRSEEVKDISKTKTAAAKDLNLLSFGGEAKEDEEESVILNKKFTGKGKSAHDHLTDPKLSSQPAVEPSGLANKKRKKGCSRDWEGDDEVQTQGELEVVKKHKENDLPLCPSRLMKTILLNNPFSDIIPRIIVQESEEVKDSSKTETTAVKDFNHLSFGGEAKEAEEESVILNKKFTGKGKSALDHLIDPKLNSQTAVESSGLANKKRKEGRSSDWECDAEVKT
ncbi:Peptidyl-prolyl cis-trans isomerase CWC27 like protein [Eufriesea mexicana]|uniref:Spliceosome-associated protein CWC27 homolog n=1 Tax=Eufriesea mexicana TaxID=516756 RepID=A0A310S565_9HYME|nr:Peptidyl-prolyl cis-trans isomerase CWC27 like protein [Eufriesea mexicana]